MEIQSSSEWNNIRRPHSSPKNIHFIFKIPKYIHASKLFLLRLKFIGNDDAMTTVVNAIIPESVRTDLLKTE